jgi:hypothetical protein
LSQNRRFQGVAIFDEKWEPKGTKNHPKIELRALRGRIFEILGGFERHRILDEFSSCKK